MSFVQFPTKIKVIEQLSDLPAPVANVITQPDTTCWDVVGTVNLGANRIVMGQNSVIRGTSPRNSILTGSNAGALITSSSSAAFNDLSILNTGAGTIFALNGTGLPGLSAVVLQRVEVDNGRLGTIQNYQVIHHEQCLYTNLLGGLTIDGTLGSVSMSNFLMTTVTASVTCLTFPSTAVVGSRIRLVNGGFNVAASATALNTSTSATIPNEAYQGHLLNFAGAGTFLTGVQANDNKALFTDCRGLPNSTSKALTYMVNNVTATTIGVISTYVKAAGTTASGGQIERFTVTDNRLTYTGGFTDSFLVFAIGSFTASTGNECGFKIYKNGVAVAESESLHTAAGAGNYVTFAIQCFVSLTTNDYVEVWTANTSATNNITVRSLNLAVNKI